MARDFTRQALYAWGWLPAETADRRAAAEDVLLVVSELVTNACLHAEGPDELFLACDNKVIRVEVSDRGAGQPAPRTPHRAGRPGGHGMFIVQRLCLDWGVVRASGEAGKTVWPHFVFVYGNFGVQLSEEEPRMRPLAHAVFKCLHGDAVRLEDADNVKQQAHNMKVTAGVA